MTTLCILVPLLLAFLCLKRSKKKSSRATPAQSSPSPPRSGGNAGVSAEQAADVNTQVSAVTRGGSPWTIVDNFVGDVVEASAFDPVADD